MRVCVCVIQAGAMLFAQLEIWKAASESNPIGDGQPQLSQQIDNQLNAALMTWNNLACNRVDNSMAIGEYIHITLLYQSCLFFFPSFAQKKMYLEIKQTMCV